MKPLHLVFKLAVLSGEVNNPTLHLKHGCRTGVGTAVKWCKGVVSFTIEFTVLDLIH